MKKITVSKSALSEMSFDKKSVPGGSPAPIALSASKKLAGAGAANLRSVSYTPENVFSKC